MVHAQVTPWSDARTTSTYSSTWGGAMTLLWALLSDWTCITDSNACSNALHFSTWGNTLSPTKREHSSFFVAENHDLAYRGWLETLPLHTQLRTAPVWAEGYCLMKQKAEMRLWGHQTGPSAPWLNQEMLSIKLINRIGNIGQAWWSPTSTESPVYYLFLQSEQSFRSSCTKT